jgi:dipeptidase
MPRAHTTVCIVFLLFALSLSSTAESCTSITLGKKATVDGSVITSHTCDSREDRTWLTIVPHMKHGKNAKCSVYNGMRFARHADLTGDVEVAGYIPQVMETFGYINTAYPCMNERQLAIGESTFGGREELRNKGALISCDELCRLAIERCATAREAIRLIDELTGEYGYNDGGECLTIADREEVWHLEIIGCGADEIGAVWAARRVPDGHVGVNANASRIRRIDLDDPDHFMASENVFDVAIERGWYDPDASGAYSISSPHRSSSIRTPRTIPFP